MRLGSKRIVALVLVGLLGGQVRALAGDASEFDPVVVLSPYEVTANSGEFERWVKVGSLHYVVYTDARVGDAITIVRQLEMLRLAVQRCFGRRSLRYGPAVFVLPTARSDWRRLQSKGSVEWQVAGSSSSTGVCKFANMQYDWQNEGLDVVWTSAGRFDVDDLGIDMVFHVSRGIGAYLETSAFTKDEVKIGRESYRSVFTRTNGWLPWAQYFGITPSSSEFIRDRDEHRQFEGQSAVFVQYMLANQDPVWLGRLLVWNAALVAGREPTEEMFTAIFGEDWKQWQTRLDAYLEGGSYLVKSFKFKPAALEIPVTELSLGPREMRELFVLTQIHNQRIPDSTVSLDSLLARGLQTVSLRPLLASDCLEWDRNDAALGVIRDIIAAGAATPEIFATAAGLRFNTTSPDSTLDGAISDADAAEIEGWCRSALAIEPLGLESCQLLAWTLAFRSRVGADDLAEIKRLCQTMEGNGRTDNLICAMAIACWRAGDSARARRACDLLVNSSFAGKKARTIARELIERIDKASASKNATTGPATPAS